jgi:hypothetical protein
MFPKQAQLERVNRGCRVVNVGEVAAWTKPQEVQIVVVARIFVDVVNLRLVGATNGTPVAVEIEDPLSLRCRNRFAIRLLIG